jgi:hypothetical protein
MPAASSVFQYSPDSARLWQTRTGTPESPTAPSSQAAAGGEDLIGVLFRVVKSQAADRETDDFMTVPRSRPG